MCCINARNIIPINWNAHFNLLIYSHLLSPITFGYLKWLNLIEFNWQDWSVLVSCLYAHLHSMLSHFKYVNSYMYISRFSLHSSSYYHFVIIKILISNQSFVFLIEEPLKLECKKNSCYYLTTEKNHLFPLNLKRFGYYTCWKQLTIHIKVIDYSRNCVATSN